jgi:penicillin-insensitive murein endopeptidase
MMNFICAIFPIFFLGCNHSTDKSAKSTQNALLSETPNPGPLPPEDSKTPPSNPVIQVTSTESANPPSKTPSDSNAKPATAAAKSADIETFDEVLVPAKSFDVSHEDLKTVQVYKAEVPSLLHDGGDTSPQSFEFISDIRAKFKDMSFTERKNGDKSPLCAIEGIKNCLVALPLDTSQATGLYFTDASSGRSGHLKNAVTLPVTGEGYVQKPNSRWGAYGTLHAVQFIKTLAAKVSKAGIIDTLVIGDIAKKKGGPFTSPIDGHLMHESHQNGLDMDIGFLPSADTQTNLEHFPRNYIVGTRISKRMSLEKNWQLALLAHESGWVYEMFVHPNVKRAFCKMAARTPDPTIYTEMLSEIVPEDSHVDHFHIRLKCPISSPDCIPEPQRAKVSGC